MFTALVWPVSTAYLAPNSRLAWRIDRHIDNRSWDDATHVWVFPVTTADRGPSDPSLFLSHVKRAGFVGRR
jgi:hypothetical protein